MTRPAGSAARLPVTRSPALWRGFSRAHGEVTGSADPARAAAAVHLVPRGAPPAAGLPVPAWEVLARAADGASILSAVASRADLLAWARAEGEAMEHRVGRRMAAVEAVRPPFAGLALDGGAPLIMGIVNVTPDSFSDGGVRLDADTAVRDGLAMVEAGAALIDVGGESSRPGAEPVAPEEEIRRVVPVVRRLAAAGVVVSIDTYHAATMEAAVAAGARVVNDISALRADPAALATVARLGVPVILMHMQGEPRTMQAAPHYSLAPLDVFDHLEERVAACLGAGIGRPALCVDPGIGFGKTAADNTAILARLGLLHGLGCASLLALSRKTVIGAVSRGEPPGERLPGSLAGVVIGAQAGMHMVRVHDVAETAQALALWRAVAASG